MTASGEPPSGAGGVDEPDWIDRILERATEQVETVTTAPAVETPTPPPIVPDPVEVAPQPVPRAIRPDATQPLPTVGVKPATNPADGLSEIRWVDSPQVTPASTPIVTPPSPAGLVPQAVGRSAWDEGLATVGAEDPEGWDKLSWQDLDEKHSKDGDTLQPRSVTSQLIREWGPVIFFAVAIALFVRLVLVQAYHIPSGSMIPTLEEGDRVVVNRLSYQFGEIDRGQVVVFQKPISQPGENDLIKRVIGLPGETVQFDNNNVFIDGLRVEEPYLAEQNSTRPRLPIEGCAQDVEARDRCVVPADHIFVMGDNRRGSQGSRVFGPVPIDSVVGRAFLRVWPLNHVGEL